MLDAAEEIVRGGQIVAHGSVDPTASRKSSQHSDRLAAAQIGMTSSGNELLGLNKELDLADAAAAKLDVMTLDRNLAVTRDRRGSAASSRARRRQRRSRDICAR